MTDAPVRPVFFFSFLLLLLLLLLLLFHCLSISRAVFHSFPTGRRVATEAAAASRLKKKTTTRNQKFISHNRTKTSKRFQCGSASEFVELFYRFIACYGRCGMMRFSFLFLFQLFWVEYKARFEEPLCVLHWIFFSLSFAQWTTHGPPRRVHCGPCFALSRSLHFIFFPR